MMYEQYKDDAFKEEFLKRIESDIKIKTGKSTVPEIKEVAVTWNGGFEIFYTVTFIDGSIQTYSTNYHTYIEYINSNNKKEDISTMLNMSDSESKVEMALQNCTNDIKLIGIQDCKYLLPCGKCDKTDLMCSQYER